jgi:hypothetical protein
MLKLRIQFDGKCELHPRYDPATSGEDGIKDACVKCRSLYGVWTMATAFRKVADQFLHYDWKPKPLPDVPKNPSGL